MTRYEGKRALVTGAASGVGLAVTQALAGAGAHVIAFDLNGSDGWGDGVEFLQGSVASRDDWSQASARVEELGGLDYLHLNAGIQIAPPDAPMAEYRFDAFDLERYRRMMGVNVDGVVFGLDALLASMRSGGAIVATASLAGVTPYEVDPLYSMSKHAVSGLVRSLAGDCAARGLSISAICPGGVDTNIIPHAQRDASAQFMAPEDIAIEVQKLFTPPENGKTWAKVARDKPAWIVRAPGDRGERRDTSEIAAE